ncbi:hypothetical protein, partial [Mycobacterium sp. E735]
MRTTRRVAVPLLEQL